MDMSCREPGAPTWSERLATYRARLDVVATGDRIAALARAEAYRDRVRDGEVSPAARRERASWLDEAVELGATPAESHAQAVAKVACLRGVVASEAAADALLDGQGGAVAMVAAAAVAEAERWFLPTRGATSLLPERGTSLAPSPADLGRRRADAGRETTDEAWARVAVVERDVVELRRSGDREEVAGAVGRLRLEVVKAAAAPASTIGGLEAKQAILCRHAGLCEPAWLVDSMIGTSLSLDYRSLGLTSSEERRLRDQLAFEPTGGAFEASDALAEPVGRTARPATPHSPTRTGEAVQDPPLDGVAQGGEA